MLEIRLKINVGIQQFFKHNDNVHLNLFSI